MGLFDLFRKQFIDVIEWIEKENGVLTYLYPMLDREIQNGAQLTVRETQAALFVNEGNIADLFQPGLYTLTTKTLPVLTSLKNWDKLFQSPFKSDVYFFSTREQIDQRWGTTNPITVKDQSFGPIRLRAHGVYSYGIRDPKIFFKKISGTCEKYTTQDLQGQLGSLILTSLASFFGKTSVPFVDMASNQLKFSQILQETLVASFEEYGLGLASFFVQSISLPESLQDHLDKSASMKIVGDLRQYAQFQTADSLSIAAANPGGAAGAGAGLGMGVVMGQTMAQALGSFPPSEDPLALLDKLHALHTKGALTQAEFETKKAEILKKIGS